MASRSLTPEQVRSIKRDLDKREAIKELMDQYTFRAIGERNGTTFQVVERMHKGLTYEDIRDDEF